MIFFKRKKNVEEERRVDILNKLVDVLNYTPVSYVHTPGYMVTPDEALDEARREVARFSALDQYSDNSTDAFHDVACNNEIEYGKEQNIKHVSTILNIFEQAEDYGIKAECVCKGCEEKIAAIDRKLKTLEALLNNQEDAE